MFNTILFTHQKKKENEKEKNEKKANESEIVGIG